MGEPSRKPIDVEAVESLDAPVEVLPGIGPKRAALLANLGIRTVGDLLRHVPRDYDDRRELRAIASVSEGDRVTILGEVVNSRTVRLRGRKTLAEATFKDDTGEIKATWFGRGFLAKQFTPWTKVILSGRVGKWKGLCLQNPEFEILSGDEEERLHTGRIVPLYRLTDKVSQVMLRKWISETLARHGDAVEDALPPELRARHGWNGATEALRQAHFPDSLEQARVTRDRFAYEELLALQLAVLRQRVERRETADGLVHRIEGDYLQNLRAKLPFRLTKAQTGAVAEVLGDMAAPRPMARLLQGDVGSGKTVVAAHAVAAALDGGYQVAFMAPTEILAEQHYRSLSEGLNPLGVTVTLLTGSTQRARSVRRDVAQGVAPVVVGTHALLQQRTEFHRLGLVIVDEQHRFGVGQRAELVAKGARPDVLHMTATPIPRTVALTAYGGMDLTIIDELPPGRRPVKTHRIPPAKLAGMYEFITERAQNGQRTFYICPVIDESVEGESQALMTRYAELTAGTLCGVRSGLLHGRMEYGEKDDVVRALQRGDIDMLFSTTVVEVGVDVPEATIMVIEDAWRFGLTQLHQLRGRVGRGAEQAYCFLLGESKTEDGERRLDIMCETTDGFRMAEEDLKLRGPGEVAGWRQAGLGDLRVADLLGDAKLLHLARRDAEEILRRDPQLEDAAHAGLARQAATFADYAL